MITLICNKWVFTQTPVSPHLKKQGAIFIYKTDYFESGWSMISICQVRLNMKKVNGRAVRA